MKKLLFSLLFLTTGLGIKAQAPDSRYPQTNNTVHAIAQDADGNTYLGGSFTAVSTTEFPILSSKGVNLNANTGAADANFPEVIGAGVYTSVPDGSGGWYIGGDFITVDGVSRNRLAHILPDGTLDANWNPNANGAVRTLVISGTDIYVGGDFTSIGGTARNRLAKIGTDGILNAVWNPDANNIVRTMAVTGTDVYVGGDFNSIGGTARSRLAKIGTDGTLDTAWDPNASSISNSIVWSLAISGTDVYVGGSFTHIGGVVRNRLARIGTDGTLDATWNPNADITVRALTVSGSDVYVGGDFNSIGGTARNRLAKIGTDGTLDATWNPDVDDIVWALAVSGTDVYVGGDFSNIGGVSRNRLAKIGTNGILDTAWKPNLTGLGPTVFSLAVSGTDIYVGGTFDSFGGISRNRLAKLGTDGTLDETWNPNADNNIWSLVVSGSDVYVGGSFTTIGGVTRNRLAKISTDGILDGAWNPNANSLVRTLVVSGADVYAGGEFYYHWRGN